MASSSDGKKGKEKTIEKEGLQKRLEEIAQENADNSYLQVSKEEMEKYDFSRTQWIDPRDPRALEDGPCKQDHEPMLFYRGSLSGKNRHARWIVCEDCKVRLEYTPAFGATGHHRQAGPLNNDTVETLRRGGTGKELKGKTVAIEGAERSLELRLAQVKAMREEESQKKDYTKKDKEQPWKPE